MKKTNPYTQAINTCLCSIQDENIDNLDKIDKQKLQLLTNCVQGRILEQLVRYVANHYNIADQHFEKELSAILLEVFKDKLFDGFRIKYEQEPQMAYNLANQIVQMESNLDFSSESDLTTLNALYEKIYKTYLEYDNIEEIMVSLENDANIQKMVFEKLLERNLPWVVYPVAKQMLKIDRQNFFTYLFILYIHLIRFYGHTVEKSESTIKSFLAFIDNNKIIKRRSLAK